MNTKEVKFYLALIFVCLFFGCKKDDDPIVLQNVLIGTWNVVEIKVEGTIGGLEVDESTNPSGTITFFESGVGKENYSYVVPGLQIPVFENDEFTWMSSEAFIVFDSGTGAEATWSRITNLPDLQIGSLTQSGGFGESYTTTIHLEK